MNNKVVSSIIAAAALTGVATAGEAVAPAEASAFSACDTLKSIGKLYKNSDNPFIQEAKVFGRAQWQYANVEGEGYNQFRRLRVGGEVKFLNYFTAMARVNVANGSSSRADEHLFGHQSYDEAKLTFDAGKAFGIDAFDKATISYGRSKINFGADQHQSSKEIKTVERTALTNNSRGDNLTGVVVGLQKGNWKGAFAVYSNTFDDHKLVDSWDDGQTLYASSTFGLENGDLIVDARYNTQSSDGVKWATSAAYVTEVADWDLSLNAVVGETQNSTGARDGFYYGVVVQPSKFIIEDKLEVVGRYYFQGSDSEQGVRANGRYSRSDLGGSGRGDEHHSVYAGLNYYLCGHNAKVMTGVEYETLDTPNGDTSAATLWSAVRFYF